jgi:hypothetical protein
MSLLCMSLASYVLLHGCSKAGEAQENACFMARFSVQHSACTGP